MPRPKGSTSEATKAATAKARAAWKQFPQIEGHKELSLWLYGDPQDPALLWFKAHGSRGMMYLIQRMHQQQKNRPFIEDELGLGKLHPGGLTGH